MIVDDIIKLIQGVGFPIAVAAFVLVRLEMRLKELTEAITGLRDQLEVNGGKAKQT